MSQKVSPLAVICSALLAALPFLLAPSAAQAQIQLELKVSRPLYILYEQIIATITITNNAGRDITLEDVGGKQWFSMEVYAHVNQLLSPYDADYKLSSLTIPAGQSVRRQIDLAPLFPIREIGPHRVRANVYLPEFDKYFSSNMTGFDLTDGKTIWRQDVGVPGNGGMRQLSLLTHRMPTKTMMYVRVRDEDNNIVYGTQPIGRLLTSGREPEAMLDRANQMHVLHLAAPKTFLYTVIGLEGERLDQKVFLEVANSRPILAKTADGGVEVRGGQIQTKAALAMDGSPATAAPVGPKLSDRPRGLPVPKPQARKTELQPRGD
jgi:hypothetical protein